MFDISFAEVLVLVTGAGLLLGKQEIALGSKLLGNGIGRIIGTLQGMKIKYDIKTKGTRLQTLHREVRQGMSEVATIGHDLSSLTYTNAMRPTAVSNIYTSTISSSTTSQQSISSSPSSSPLSSLSSSSLSFTNNDIDTERIAHLILVDQKMNKTTSNSTDGVDIIIASISESILADNYAMKMNTTTNNDNSNMTNNNTVNNSTTDDKK